MDFETRICQNCQKDFTIEPDDFSFYEKIKVPPPTWCPECRLIRRMNWRNERNLYKKKNEASEKREKILSMYSSNSPYVIYDKEYWWSDEWDPFSYGREYNFQKSFFEQFDELLKNIQLQALQLMNSVQSQYCNYIDHNKNCYLVFGTGFSENSRYLSRASFSKESQDLLTSNRNELCFDLVDCFDCFNLISSESCNSCINSVFLYGCRNCNDCFGCSNLINKSYCFFNAQLKKEEYAEKIKSLSLGSNTNLIKIREKFNKEIKDKAIHRFANVYHSTNCTGHNIYKSKNSKNCFDIMEDAEDSKYGIHSLNIKDNYDVYGNYKNELCYEGVDNDVGMNNIATITVYSSNNCSYCFTCQASSNLFGCVGLREKEYCILNKQYSKEKYFELKLKIIKHMNQMPYRGIKRVYGYGEFFPVEISPWAYNETIAQEYYPLTKEEALNKGYRWKEEEERNYPIEIRSGNIPDNIEDVGESFIGKVIECDHKGKCNEQCTEAFKIILEELQFYKRMNLPIPHFCSNCRHYQRLKQRNPMKLWNRECMCDDKIMDIMVNVKTNLKLLMHQIDLK